MLKVLIGYDGSGCADEAIDDLLRAGLGAEGVEAVVMTVADVWPNEPGAAYSALYPDATAAAVQRLGEALATAQQLAAQGQARVAGLFPQWQVSARAVADSPYWGLVQESERWDADLLVVGSNGRSSVGRLVLGSVSHNAILYAGCSVRVSRCRTQRAAADAPARLVIGWDGSADAALAVRTVAGRRWPAGSEVRVLTGVGGGPGPATATEIQGDKEVVTGSLMDIARAAIEELRAAGLSAVDPAVRPGSPANVLVQEAGAWPADAIFVGAKGTRGIKQVLLGSVASAVASRSPCSVEIVRSRHQK